MRVNADREVCIGAGNCVFAAPEVFDQAADGLVDVLDAKPPASLQESVRDAVARCPSGAISVSEPNPEPGSGP
jgi:ferredoxin